ncbi:MAG: DUF4398 domain-containing protein [Geminicoccaceae bacterium]
MEPTGKNGIRRGLSWTIVALTASLAGACASTRPPPTLLQARQSVEQAREAPADEYAALELHEAQEKLAAAESAAATDKNAEAERFAQEALINVQLAQAKADAERAESAANELNQGVETLRQETERSRR